MEGCALAKYCLAKPYFDARLFKIGHRGIPDDVGETVILFDYEKHMTKGRKGCRRGRRGGVGG